MNSISHTGSKRGFILLGGALFLVLFQWLSRYAGAPVVDFTVDDWRLWKIASSCSSLGEAFMQALNWPDRPLGAGIMMASYYLMDDHILAYNIAGYVYTAAYLLVGMGAVYALTHDGVTAFVYGVLFSVLPNLTESYQWHTMSVSYGVGFTAYLLTVWLWVRYVEHGGAARLIAVSGSFAVALFSYEIGILIPAALLLLCDPGNKKRALAGLSGLGVVILAYLAWKFTDGFGTLGTLLFPKRQVEFDVAGYAWNAREVVRWWTGTRVLEAFAHGLDGFLTLSTARLMWLIPITMIAAAVAVTGWRRGAQHVEAAFSKAPFSAFRLVVFSLAWFAVVNVITVLSWPGGRMNYLPAFGFCLGLAVMSRRWFRNAPGVATWLLLVLFMFSNQGTSAQWRDSGLFHRALYEYLGETRSVWQEKTAMVVDTSMFRDRLTPGLLSPPSYDILHWGHYGNATLIRGAFVSTMVTMLSEAPVEVMLDMEYGITREGDEVAGYGWYDRSTTWRRPMNEIYWLDLREVIARVGRKR
ncbi:MAG TPA: hypothetical protein PKE26_06195 [Kiritimatiellia bacterium]|nr:hypothetical protein [Kiritimatiellia bacterium]HMO98683.1 hypothetical protein [Kiritimatiellia bacterium]